MSEHEKYHVFLACKEIFTGPNAFIRKPKQIEKQITQHQAALGRSIPNFNVKKVAGIAHDLLHKRVFESDIKDKAEFSGLFTPSPAKKTQLDVPKTEAVRSTTHVLEEISSVHEKEQADRAPLPIETGAPAPAPASVEAEAPAPTVNGDTNTNTAPKYTPTPNYPRPSLHPLYFPYSAQHCILTSTQQVLEESCFEFTKKWLPSEIEAREWDCAAALELTRWMDFLTEQSQSQPARLPDEALRLRGPELDALVFKIRQIRHTAVHRVPTTAPEVGTMVLEALRLVEALQDPVRMSQLEDLYGDIRNKVQAMELSKGALEDGLVSELEAIRLQREELDRREEWLRDSTVRSDRDNKALVGFLVKQSVARIFNVTGSLDDSSGFETADDGAEDE